MGWGDLNRLLMVSVLLICDDHVTVYSTSFFLSRLGTRGQFSNFSLLLPIFPLSHIILFLSAPFSHPPFSHTYLSHPLSISSTTFSPLLSLSLFLIHHFLTPLFLSFSYPPLSQPSLSDLSLSQPSLSYPPLSHPLFLIHHFSPPLSLSTTTFHPLSLSLSSTTFSPLTLSLIHHFLTLSHSLSVFFFPPFPLSPAFLSPTFWYLYPLSFSCILFLCLHHPFFILSVFILTFSYCFPLLLHSFHFLSSFIFIFPLFLSSFNFCPFFLFPFFSFLLYTLYSFLFFSLSLTSYLLTLPDHFYVFFDLVFLALLLSMIMTPLLIRFQPSSLFLFLLFVFEQPFSIFLAFVFDSSVPFSLFRFRSIFTFSLSLFRSPCFFSSFPSLSNRLLLFLPSVLSFFYQRSLSNSISLFLSFAFDPSLSFSLIFVPGC